MLNLWTVTLNITHVTGTVLKNIFLFLKFTKNLLVKQSQRIRKQLKQVIYPSFYNKYNLKRMTLTCNYSNSTWLFI